MSRMQKRAFPAEKATVQSRKKARVVEASEGVREGNG